MPESVHLHIYKFRSFVIENTTRLHCKDKPVTDVYGNNLFIVRMVWNAGTLRARNAEFLRVKQALHTYGHYFI